MAVQVCGGTATGSSSPWMSLMTVTSHLILKLSSLTYKDSSSVFFMNPEMPCDIVLLENVNMLLVPEYTDSPAWSSRLNLNCVNTSALAAG